MAKKIGAIVSLSIIGVLILATIIMANVNVNYSIKCATPATVYVSYSGGTEMPEDAHKDAIVKYINNASKEKSLTALFNKTLGKKAEVKVGSEKTIPTNSEGFNVRYRYNEPQKLMYGKNEYKDANGNVVYYEDLVFAVKQASGTQTFIVYVVQDNENSNKYTYYYELEADFEELYNYLTNNCKV